MPVLHDWNLALDADMVLWGQGADPAIIRARRPTLAALAERVIEEGRPLLEPAVAYERLCVVELRHERLIVRRPLPVPGRATAHLAGPLIVQHLAAVQEVCVAVCTVGEGLSQYAAEQFAADSVRGLALDGLASAAAEALAEALCRRVEQMAAAEGLQTSIPLNPGMIGWPLEEGQGQVFELLDTRAIGVSLSPSGLMRPLKSVSLVIGIGRELERAGESCDYCAMRELCRYRDRDHSAVRP